MSDDLQQSFESRLHAAWLARDFAAWLDVLPIYADYLEEQDHPLYRMVRCPVRMHPCTVRTAGGPRVWLWRLYFDFPGAAGDPRAWGKPRPRWWANQRVNAKQLLGFPVYTLRCKGWEEETRTLRFTVAFKPHPIMRIVALRGYHGWYEDRRTARDTDIHPDGFAAAFWTPAAGVVREVTPNDLRAKVPVQGGLFS